MLIVLKNVFTILWGRYYNCCFYFCLHLDGDSYPGSRRVFYDMWNRVEHQKLNQEAAELPPGWVFGVQLGLRQTQSLIKTKTIGRGRLPPATLLIRSKLLLNSNVTGGNLPLPIVLVLICDCVCRRPSWTPKTQPGGSSAASWLSFWCSTRLLM